MAGATTTLSLLPSQRCIKIYTDSLVALETCFRKEKGEGFFVGESCDYAQVTWTPDRNRRQSSRRRDSFENRISGSGLATKMIFL